MSSSSVQTLQSTNIHTYVCRGKFKTAFWACEHTLSALEIYNVALKQWLVEFDHVLYQPNWQCSGPDMIFLLSKQEEVISDPIILISRPVIWCARYARVLS